MFPRPLLGATAALALLLASGCQPSATSMSPTSSAPSTPQEIAAAANAEFLKRGSYDPWILKAPASNAYGPAYLADGRNGYLIDNTGKITQVLTAGKYDANGNLAPQPILSQASAAGAAGDMQLDLQTGTLSITRNGQAVAVVPPGFQPRDWRSLWAKSDVAICGDAEAQQVTHANLFYLLSSTYPGSTDAIPPMGLSNTLYNGHIFWDADSWMLPVLIVQHPADGRSIVDYRFKTLPQAIQNAKAAGLPGAAYAWESADTGAEHAPAEFARERHITADVAFGAWQYYVWTGDKAYLAKEGWPILRDTAQYWAAFAKKSPDGAYHIDGVIPPDETAGTVDDDLYTNTAAKQNLLEADRAATILGEPADPKWTAVAVKLANSGLGSPSITTPINRFPPGIPAAYAGGSGPSMAKQADALLVLQPLGERYTPDVAGRMLGFYSEHTIPNGPAMTGGIHAAIAAQLGRGPQSLDFYHDSYRPFERGPFDAFSEKRSATRVYFCTGMAANLEALFYGFAGLDVVPASSPSTGTRLAGDSVAALYANPHLPPGWTSLTIKGIQFRGKTVDMTVDASNKVTVNAR